MIVRRRRTARRACCTPRPSPDTASAAGPLARVSLRGRPATAKPLPASCTAGSTSCAHCALPYFLCASAKPRHRARHADRARLPMVNRRRVRCPLESVNIVRRRRRGAVSRKSIVVARPSGKRITMNPPPPMLPAVGYVTASANPVATAASTALPPFASTSRPTSLAMLLAETTIPRGAVSTRVAATVVGNAVRTGGEEHAAPRESAPSSRTRPGRARMEKGVIDVEGRSGRRSNDPSRCAARSGAQFANHGSRFTSHVSPLTCRHATRVARLARCTRADAVVPRRSVTSVTSGDAPSRNGIPQ